MCLTVENVQKKIRSYRPHIQEHKMQCSLIRMGTG